MALPEGLSDILPLTPAQRGMLFHVLETPESGGRYVAVLSCRIDGPLDAARLRAAMTQAVNARDAYRAGFVWDGVKQPVQTIQETVDLPWTDLDWTDAQDTSSRLDDLIGLERLRQFDLKRAPLMHTTLIRVSANLHHLVWTIHHVISDGWSTGVVFEDVFERYTNPDIQVAPSTQFKAYLVWLKKNQPVTAEAFWQDHLSGLDGPSRIETRTPTHQTHKAHGHIIRTCEAEVMAGVERLAKALRVTRNTVLSGIWALVLRKLTGQNDVVFGQTHAGRPPQIPGIAQAAGAFINTLPVRCVLDPEEPVRDVLKRFGQIQQDLAHHPFASLEEVQKLAPIPRGTALFDTLFVNEQMAPYPDQFGDIRLSDVQTVQSSNYALAMLATPGDTLALELYFDPAKMSDAAAQDCMQHYVDTLMATLAQPDTTVRDLAWRNAPDIIVPPSDAYPSVVHRFLQQAAAHPDATAVSDTDTTWTYADLSDRARRIAQAVQHAGAKPGDVIPVATQRNAETVACYLGVMMAGAAYVPMDLTYPAERIAQIIDQVQPRHILTQPEATDALPPHPAQLVLTGDLPDPLPVSDIATDDLAYVLFTSGSQGSPKGVEITHASLAHSTGVRDIVYSETPTTYLLLSSFSFDSSVAGIYWTLATGGHLIIAASRIEQDPAALGALIADNAVTHTLCLPGLLSTLLDTTPSRQLTSLRTVIAAGEALPPALIPQVKVSLPHCRIFNEYGPTEGTVWCTAYDATPYDGTNTTPIGQALPGVWVGVCDPDGVPLPAGQTGQIVIAGPIVARGYLNAPDQTKAAFPTVGPARTRVYFTGDLGRTDADGTITFLGRADPQVKIRGQRIELGEIEAVAQTVMPAQEVAALIKQDTMRAQIILCVSGHASAADESRLRQALSTRLPDAFQPAQIQFLPDFPRLPNGKLDRQALAASVLSEGQHDAGHAPLQSELETQLAGLFADVLGAPVTSRDAHFFDLGGDSLMTIAAYSKARAQGLPLAPTDIFDHPTVKGLAARILSSSTTELASSGDTSARFINTDGTGAAVFLVHGTTQLFYQMARGLGQDHPVGLLHSHYFHGVHVPLGITVDDLADQALGDLRRLRPHGPYVLCGYSAAAPIVMELAHRIGETEDVDIFLLDPPYMVLGRDPGVTLKDQQTTRLKLATRIARHALRIPFLLGARAVAPRSEKIRKLWVRSAYVFALSRYRMRRYDKPVQIYITDGNPALAAGSVTDVYLPNKHVEDLPVQHADVVSAPAGIVAVTQRVASFLSARGSR